MKKEYRLTKEGVKKLEVEIDELRSRRPEIAEKIRVAREHGDLSENAEYQTARDELGALENRINEIKNILKSVEIIAGPKKSDAVSIGSTVTLGGDGSVTYQIVGSLESNPIENKISDESPIGKALLGKKVGEKVTIVLPATEKKYTVKSIK